MLVRKIRKFNSHVLRHWNENDSARLRNKINQALRMKYTGIVRAHILFVSERTPHYGAFLCPIRFRQAQSSVFPEGTGESLSEDDHNRHQVGTSKFFDVVINHFHFMHDLVPVSFGIQCTSRVYTRIHSECKLQS